MIYISLFLQIRPWMGRGEMGQRDLSSSGHQGNSCSAWAEFPSVVCCVCREEHFQQQKLHMFTAGELPFGKGIIWRITGGMGELSGWVGGVDKSVWSRVITGITAPNPREGLGGLGTGISQLCARVWLGTANTEEFPSPVAHTHFRKSWEKQSNMEKDLMKISRPQQ